MKEPQSRTTFETVAEYLDALPEAARRVVAHLREIILDTAPQATEQISYQMPGYAYHGVLVWIAAHKRHAAVYVRPAMMQPFLERLGGYELTKSAIRFPFDRPMEDALLRDIVLHVARHNEAAAALRPKRRKPR